MRNWFMSLIERLKGTIQPSGKTQEQRRYEGSKALSGALKNLDDLNNKAIENQKKLDDRGKL